LGIFVVGAMKQIGADEMVDVIESIATCSVNWIADLANIVAERDSQNDAAESIPPALRNQLVKLRGQEFTFIFIQKKHLSVRWSAKKLTILTRFL
jgi:hypothetical protein